MAFELPPLPYDYDALEPSIDEETMRLHHDKHHAGYTNNLNDAISGTEWENKSAEEILQNLDQLPSNIRTKVRNNGGGYVNHALFWVIMSPNGGGQPSGTLADAINQKWGSFDNFKNEFQSTSTGQFGSGWGWLYVDANGNLGITSTPNQDTPLMEGNTPILGLDVWEHAYYKKYGPARAEYATNWWNVVDWNEVSRRYEAAKSGDRRVVR
ncbi:MAG: superoxide dismutase [Chloroflexota bacterium]|nr:superoxide dismutase [Chloroflexota bacterium]